MKKETCMTGCEEGFAPLPTCGNLAVPYIPMQGASASKYSHTEALNNGTLYPGLNLPFHLKVDATNVVNSPYNELQALEFVVLELSLYLDTHPSDQEALALFKQYVDMERTTRQEFIKDGRAFTASDSAHHDTYTWVTDPWPWCLPKERGV